MTSIAVLSYLASFFLFQNAVTTFAKFWNPTPTRLDIDIFFIALKNPTHYPELWGFGKHLYLSVIILAIFFAFVTSGIAALLLPIKYHRSTTLTGTELDFASNNTDCINWFDNNGISSECGWQVSLTLLSRCTHHYLFQRFKGLIYNDCLNNNRMLDAIQAGHSNVCDSKQRKVIFGLKTATGSVHTRKPHQQRHICIQTTKRGWRLILPRLHSGRAAQWPERNICLQHPLKFFVFVLDVCSVVSFRSFSQLHSRTSRGFK